MKFGRLCDIIFSQTRTHEVLIEFIGGIYHVRENSQKKNKKGFTLVELIVVLVILAILAALLIPAMTGYIDKAREQSMITEASMVLTAAQATVSEAYGTGDIKADGTIKDDTAKKAMIEQIKELAELKDGATWKFDIVVGSETNYKSVKIKNLIYSKDNNSIAYNVEKNWGSTQKNTALSAAKANNADGTMSDFLTNVTN